MTLSAAQARTVSSIAEGMNRGKIAAEEEARQRGCKGERRMEESRRRRRKPMDVLNVFDVCVKETNLVVRKNSKKKADVAKEENGERLIK